MTEDPTALLVASVLPAGFAQLGEDVRDPHTPAEVAAHVPGETASRPR